VAQFKGIFPVVRYIDARKGTWRYIEHVEWATLNYFDWFNNRRIHEALNYVSPVAFEEPYSKTIESESLPVLEMIWSPSDPSRLRVSPPIEDIGLILSLKSYMTQCQSNQPSGGPPPPHAPPHHHSCARKVAADLVTW
jgi:hypothetical protein